jgi:hypothetical protein
LIPTNDSSTPAVAWATPLATAVAATSAQQGPCRVLAHVATSEQTEAQKAARREQKRLCAANARKRQREAEANVEMGTEEAKKLAEQNERQRVAHNERRRKAHERQLAERFRQTYGHDPLAVTAASPPPPPSASSPPTAMPPASPSVPQPAPSPPPPSPSLPSPPSPSLPPNPPATPPVPPLPTAAAAASPPRAPPPPSASSPPPPPSSHRVVKLPWDAARLERRRPCVVLMDHEQRLLQPVPLVDRHGARDDAAVEDARAARLQRHDGTPVAAQRSAAVRGIDRRQEAKAKEAAPIGSSKWRVPPPPPETASKATTSRKHPNGLLENGGPTQHVLHELMWGAVASHRGRGRCEVPGPREAGPDVQITEVVPERRADGGGAAAGCPIATVVYVRESSPEWRAVGGGDLRAALDAAIDGTCERAHERGAGGVCALWGPIQGGTRVHHQS